MKTLKLIDHLSYNHKKEIEKAEQKEILKDFIETFKTVEQNFNVLLIKHNELKKQFKKLAHDYNNRLNELEYRNQITMTEFGQGVPKSYLL